MKKVILFVFALVFSISSYAGGPSRQKGSIAGHVMGQYPLTPTITDQSDVPWDYSLVQITNNIDANGKFTLSVQVSWSGVRLLQITNGVNGSTGLGYWYGGTFCIDGGTTFLPVNSVYTSDSANDGPVDMGTSGGYVKFEINLVDADNHDQTLIYEVSN